MNKAERKTFAKQYAAKYVHDDVRRDIEKAILAGCEFEARGGLIKGEVLEADFEAEQIMDGVVVEDEYLYPEPHESLIRGLFKSGDRIEMLIRKKK